MIKAFTCLSEKEMLALADELKPDVQERMKIEMAPWVKGYAVDMDELYTELTLELTENKASGPEYTKINDFKLLFEDKLTSTVNDAVHTSVLGVRTKPFSKPRRKKILIKGDPGKGKTTLMKKMGWDWATGMFKKFSFVFFVFLKLVRPQETIENVVIRQHPVLKATNVKANRVKEILEIFGDRCLIIFDGLDEHAVGQNQDVLEIIRGEKLPHCNIIVTSRPHCTAELEQHFDIVGRVKGFSFGNTVQFALCLLKDKKKVSAVLNFTQTVDYSRGIYNNLLELSGSPILVLFLCILTREGQFDLEKESFSWTGIGRVYYKLSQCLYRKYTERKGIQYVKQEFLDVMVRIGKIAWEMLMSKESCFQKSRVIRVVGPDAFEYGFFIDHEDYRLFGDETADIFIDFPHRSLQDFFGSFYFIWSLHSGKNIADFVGVKCQHPPFLLSPIILQFCLWFSGTKDIFSNSPTETYYTIKSYISDKINHLQLDLKTIKLFFPALYFPDSNKVNVMKSFLVEILGTLNKTKQLICIIQ